jgi:phage shock protein PspC (stress-responsive transcriptional regulator)
MRNTSSLALDLPTGHNCYRLTGLAAEKGLEVVVIRTLIAVSLAVFALAVIAVYAAASAMGGSRTVEFAGAEHQAQTN